MLSKSKQYYNYYKDSSGNYMPELSLFELAMKYINKDYNNENRCISEIIVRCWNVFDVMYYQRNPNMMIPLEDMHDIFLDSLCYILEKRVWLDKSNKLYNDKDAVIKSLYTVMESRRKNYLIAQFRQKRKLNTTSISIDFLKDKFQDGYFSKTVDNIEYNKSILQNIIVNKFNKKQYITAIILDAILNYNVFNSEGFDKRKLKKYLKNISIENIQLLNNRYNINIEKCPDIKDLDKTIYNVLNQLKMDEEIRNVVLDN